MRTELRYNPDLELRQAPDGTTKIRGYAAVFGQLSQPIVGEGVPRFRERIVPGAFAKSISSRADVRALVNHRPELILGRVKNNTLAMREDHHGLYVEITPPDTQVGRDAAESVRRGDLDGMSFAFRVPDKSGQVWTREGGENIRELRSVECLDVSVVTFPAYEGTSVGLRSLWPDGMPDGLCQHLADSNRGYGPAPKELHAFEAWWQAKIVSENERRIRLDEELERARTNAELRLSPKERRERWIRERMAELDKQARAEYQRRDEERRKEIEGRCKIHTRFSCLTCYPPQWSGWIIT